MLKAVTNNPDLIAYCGLYCGACRRYRAEKCPGCRENEKATWCKVRACCVENGYRSCAGCEETDDRADCKKLHNLIAKFFAFFFRSDRDACLARIEEAGYEAFAEEMAEKQAVTIRK